MEETLCLAMPDTKTGLSRNMTDRGYTVEAGMGKPLPMTQFERIYHDNKGILVGGMTQLR